MKAKLVVFGGQSAIHFWDGARTTIESRQAQVGASGSHCFHQSDQHSKIEARVFCFPDQGTQGRPAAGVAGTFLEPDPPSAATTRDVARFEATSVECCAQQSDLLQFLWAGCKLDQCCSHTWRYVDQSVDFEIPRYGRMELCGDEDRIWDHKIRVAARLVRWRQVKRKKTRTLQVNCLCAHTVGTGYFEVHTV